MKTIKFAICHVLLGAVFVSAQPAENMKKVAPARLIQNRDASAGLNLEQSTFEEMNAIVQPEAIKKDIDLWFEWLHAVHPDLSYTVKNIDKFYNTVDQIKDGINAPMTPLEFWRRFSVLNSQLSDGHLVVGNPAPQYLKEYLASGGTLFPFEVAVLNGSELVITNQLGGGESDLSGYQILKINKMPVETVLDELLLRLNGDGDAHRKAILQRRFAYLYMLLYGENKQFELTLSKNKSVRQITVESANLLPLTYKIADSFADNFQFKRLDNQNALLTINTFGWAKKEEYFEFIRSAFSAMKSKNTQHLIIDIRENSGGDDDMWREILKYVADKPYRWGSKYRKKILAKYRDEGQVIGQVVDGQIETLIQPEINNPHKFGGRVSILIGPYTYSSAILFVNTVQDYAFGRLVGTPTGGKSGQTGATQFLTLPNTRLRSVCPRFYLERPNGGKMKEPVKPDLEIAFDQTNQFDLIKRLLDNSAK